MRQAPKWHMSTGMAGFFHPSPLPLPMRDVLLKHLTLFPCQENKNGASVRSCAVLEADAVLCLAACGGRGWGEKSKGVGKAGAMVCARHSEIPWGSPWAWRREGVLRLDTRKQEFAHFAWQIPSGKSLAGARAWALSSLLEPLPLQKWCRIKQAVAEAVSASQAAMSVGLAGLGEWQWLN